MKRLIKYHSVRTLIHTFIWWDRKFNFINREANQKFSQDHVSSSLVCENQQPLLCRQVVSDVQGHQGVRPWTCTFSSQLVPAQSCNMTVPPTMSVDLYQLGAERCYTLVNSPDLFPQGAIIPLPFRTTHHQRRTPSVYLQSLNVFCLSNPTIIVASRIAAPCE